MAAFAARITATAYIPTRDAFARWWNSPTRYDLVVSYLSARSLVGALRLVVGGCAGALAIVPFVMQYSPLGPQTVFWRSIDIVAALIGAFWMLRWWLGPLPRERESAVFAVTSVAAIWIGCFADSDHVTGMFGLAALSLMAIYICAFHGARLITLYLVTSLPGLAIMAIIVAVQHGWAVALAKSIISAALMIGVPPIIHFAQLVLTNDAAAAGIDQLTGLRNRRGFDDQSTALVTAARSREAELSAIMIDLDRFKKINDLFGHTVGDQVIVATAARIEEIAGDSAVVGRLGGEEFCVMVIAPAPQAQTLAERIRAGVESVVAAPVTGSVGVATAQPLASAARGSVVACLVTDADHAMYSAKRNGGNRVEIWQG
ncbi:GGDEF domain-containing protein [Mycobacterium sp. CBMA271]|uniref:GGDEF domain-containing protein n=1 Tax=unclassified Mycobacteroides TaxID=2618759 RepID=UPI0012DC0025|nr:MULTISPECIES: GGDEF domain-containing protein [unclassified Mycobacteroides]MUM18521.1 hypothetical protein [Mycobacteroides sp. CBMA 326]MUM23790.1 GGDEF domain-containing protein [Mycobacteroides sp. CBMA 271]